MGWEPVEVTSYIYEGDRLVKAVTVRESEYRDADLMRLLELNGGDLEPRTPHGTLLSDAISPDADPSNSSAKYRFEVGLPHIDFEARALAEAQAKYEAEFPDADLSYLRWSVTRRAKES